MKFIWQVAEITYHVGKSNSEKSKAHQFSTDEIKSSSRDLFPAWAVAELYCYPKVLLQLATNLVAGNVRTQVESEFVLLTKLVRY